jgi:hypothetical protein
MSAEFGSEWDTLYNVVHKRYYVVTIVCPLPLSVSLVQSVRKSDNCAKLNDCIDWVRAGRPGDRIPVGARFSALVQTGPGAHPASCTVGTGSFPGVESGRGATLTPHPLLVPRSKNRVELYLYSP